MASGRSLPQRLILDSGAVIGWSRGDPRTRAVLREAIARHLELRVPVVVLNRALKAVGTASTTPAIGRDVGRLLGRSGGSNTADALVAAEALAIPGSTILTSDPDDLWALLAVQPGIEVQAA